jgi:SAM-dependent methyltransferase
MSMSLPSPFTRVSRKARQLLREAYFLLYRTLRRPLAGEVQRYDFTLPDRYPWLFGFASGHLQPRQSMRILSFGCSRGEEVFSLRGYFPAATIKGIDVNPRNIARCEARLRKERAVGVEFEVAASTQGEPQEHYDAIFCLAVLVMGDLTRTGAQRSDPLFTFEHFERIVTDFARCLKPGGLLLLHTTSYRFCDTTVARDFVVVHEAPLEELAPDPLFDRDNRLMAGERQRYRAVAFQKRTAPG